MAGGFHAHANEDGSAVTELRLVLYAQRNAIPRFLDGATQRADLGGELHLAQSMPIGLYGAVLRSEGCDKRLDLGLEPIQ